MNRQLRTWAQMEASISSHIITNNANGNLWKDYIGVMILQMVLNKELRCLRKDSTRLWHSFSFVFKKGTFETSFFSPLSFLWRCLWRGSQTAISRVWFIPRKHSNYHSRHQKPCSSQTAGSWILKGWAATKKLFLSSSSFFFHGDATPTDFCNAERQLRNK